MQPVHRLLRRATLWIHFKRMIELLFVSLTIGTGTLLGLKLVDRLIGLRLDWPLTWGIALALAAALAIMWVALTWRKRLIVARLLDDSAQLKETISTALCVERQTDPWSRAAVAHAARVAPGIPVARSMPIHARRWWVAPVLLAGLFFLAGLLPQYDLLKLIERADAKNQDKIEVVQARQEVEAMEDRLKDLLAQVDEGALDDPEPELPDAQPQTPDAIRKAAVKKLTKLQDRLDSLKSSAQGESLDALKKKLGELNTSKMSELDDMAKALKSGNFQLAQKKLEELAAKLAQGELTDEQRQALEEQLKNLAEQFKKLADQRKALEDALKKAGIDPNLASDPAALKKALEQAQNLTPDQKKQLQQMAEATNQACKACAGMAKGAASAANKLAQGASGAFGEMGSQLSEMEMLQQQMDQLDALSQKLGQEMAGMCDSMGQCNSSMLVRSKFMRPGGNRGPGGARQNVEVADFNTKKIKVKSKNQPGPIIGSTLVEGDQIRGESSQQFAQAVAAGSVEAADAIENKQVPRELHDAVKTYFGRLEKEGKGGTPSEPASDTGR